MADQHAPFYKRAQAAVHAATQASGPPSQLDELMDDLHDPQLAEARRAVANEDLVALHGHLFKDDWPVKDLAFMQNSLADSQARLRNAGMMKLRDGGRNFRLMIARKERYIALVESATAPMIRLHEQQQQQQQQLPPRSAGGSPPGAGEQQGAAGSGASQSKIWLEKALQNAKESSHPSAQQQQQHRQQQQRYVGQQPLSGTRDFSQLNSPTDGAPPAARGAVMPTAPLNLRHSRLLNVSKPQRQQQGAAPLPRRQQQHAPSQPGALVCEFCNKPPAAGKGLKRVLDRDDQVELDACFDCIQKAGSVLQPLPARKQQQQQQGTLDAVVVRQQPGDAWKQQQQQQQARKPQLALKKVPSSQFHSQLPSAHNATLLPAFGGGVVGAGVAAAGAAPGGRQPTRGRGKAAKGKPSDEDREYVPGQHGRRARTGKGRGGGRAAGAAAALGRLDDGSESESDFEMAVLGRQQRRPSTRQRGGAGQQEANAEPVTIDLLSDEDGGGDGSQPGAAAGAGASGGEPETAGAPAHALRPTRTSAWRSTSERFKGLKCLYPPGGGPGAVEVTYLDLPRLDPDEFLNDTVIDFYLRWLQDQLPEEVARRCYFFNTFFFKKLTETSGGTLPPEIEVYAKQHDMKGDKLQALRNHQKVKKWTKDVDLFSKDFIFVPVHEALHWSLMVVCHPGVVMTDIAQEAAGAAGASPLQAAHHKPAAGEKMSLASRVPRGQKTPCILHLDSIKGSHNIQRVTNKLRLYLQFEWDLKAESGPPDCVPRRWAAEHPGQTRQWRPTHDFPSRSLKVPKQDNHCDCGLFMCSYPEFFTYRLPPAICLPEVEDLNQSYSRENKDLFEGTEQCYPGFLTEKWFPDCNPTNLRNEMRKQILELMAEQNHLWNKETDVWNESDPRTHEVQGELLELAVKLADRPYLRPNDWEKDAITQKQRRQLAIERRKREAVEGKERRAQRQAGAAKWSSGAEPDRVADREVLAQAAMKRTMAAHGSGGAPLGGSQRSGGGSELFAGIGAVAAQAESGSDDFEAEHLPKPARKRLRQQADAAAAAAAAAGVHAEVGRQEEDMEQPQVEAGTQGYGSQPPDEGFKVDLEGSEAEEGSMLLGSSPEQHLASAARDIVASAQLPTAQGAGERQQQRKQRKKSRVVEESEEDESEEEDEDEGGAQGGGGRAAQPGSPPDIASQQHQQQHEEEAGPARKRQRNRRQKKAALREQQQQQQQQQQGQPGQPLLVAAAGSDSDTQDAGGSSREGSDAEIEIVGPVGQQSGRSSRQQPAQEAQAAQPAKLQAQAQAHAQPPPAAARKKQSKQARPSVHLMPITQRGQHKEVDWGKLVAVKGVLRPSWDAPNAHAMLHFWEQGDEPSGPPTLQLPFLVNGARLADSVADLRAWQAAHKAQLKGVADQSFDDIDAWERTQGAGQQPQAGGGRQDQPAPAGAPSGAQQEALAVQEMEDEMEGLHLQAQAADQRGTAGPAAAAAAAAAGHGAAGAGAGSGPSRAGQGGADVEDLTGDDDTPPAGTGHSPAVQGLLPVPQPQQQQQPQQQYPPHKAPQEPARRHGNNGKRKQHQPTHLKQRQQQAAGQPPSKQQRKAETAKHDEEAAGGAARGGGQQQQQQQQQHEARKEGEEAAEARQQRGLPEQQPERQQAGVAFNRHLFEQTQQAQQGQQAQQVVPGQPPPQFGSAKQQQQQRQQQQPPPAQLKGALKMMNNAGSATAAQNYQHREVKRRRDPASQSPAKRSASGHAGPSSSQAPAQTPPEFGRPPLHDPRMAAAPHASEYAAAAVQLAATALEEATASVQRQQQQQQHVSQPAQQGIDSAVVRRAGAGMANGAAKVKQQREAAEKRKLLKVQEVVDLVDE